MVRPSPNARCRPEDCIVPKPLRICIRASSFLAYRAVYSLLQTATPTMVGSEAGTPEMPAFAFKDLHRNRQRCGRPLAINCHDTKVTMRRPIVGFKRNLQASAGGRECEYSTAQRDCPSAREPGPGQGRLSAAIGKSH